MTWRRGCVCSLGATKPCPCRRSAGLQPRLLLTLDSEPGWPAAPAPRHPCASPAGCAPRYVRPTRVSESLPCSLTGPAIGCASRSPRELERDRPRRRRARVGGARFELHLHRQAVPPSSAPQDAGRGPQRSCHLRGSKQCASGTRGPASPTRVTQTPSDYRRCQSRRAARSSRARAPISKGFCRKRTPQASTSRRSASSSV